MKDQQRPAWLQTLWNVNPRLAAEAETELTLLYDIKAKAVEMANFIKTLK